MSNTGKYLRLNELGMNREERRKMAKEAKKGKSKDEKKKLDAGMASVEDVLKVVSANRKRANRRKK